MRLIITTLLTVLLLNACSSKESWTGYYYPDKNNIGDESTWVIQNGFNTIEACRGWVNSSAGNNTNFDYECGYNCEYKSSYEMTVCERTEK